MTNAKISIIAIGNNILFFDAFTLILKILALNIGILITHAHQI
ncbi:MAG: hypothetical protein ACFFFB_00185 [Candidatus Heimdallarchaeota archaeon]